MKGSRGRLLAKLETLDDERIEEVLNDILDSEPGSRDHPDMSIGSPLPPPDAVSWVSFNPGSVTVESPTGSPSSPFGRNRDLEILIEVVVTADTMEGEAFSKWKQEGVMYHQDGFALATVHSKVRDFISAMVELGFESARLHGEGPQG